MQNLSLLPTFASVESLFSAPIPASFLPSNEVPKGLPETKALARMARNIFPHWKDRREKRKGRTIMPSLNVCIVLKVASCSEVPQYDETNDGDPYVCFRRRDTRATRKTRRTDNFSVERMQKIQTELRSAHNLAQMVSRREQEKAALYQAEKDVWEAKWKLFETKRRWPSLGMTREEEEVITGRTTGAQAATVNINLLGGHEQSVQQNRKRLPERERDEREKRERAMEVVKAAEKGITSTGRSSAPDVLRERMLALRQRLEEEMAKRKEADLQWDDATDVSGSAFSENRCLCIVGIISAVTNIPSRPFLSAHHRPRSSLHSYARRRRRTWTRTSPASISVTQRTRRGSSTRSAESCLCAASWRCSEIWCRGF